MNHRTFTAVAMSGSVLLVAMLSWLGAPIQGRRKSRPVPVKVAAVELNTAGGGEQRYSATIIPRTEVELAFKVGGYVDAIQQVRGVDGRMRDLQEGDRISAGSSVGAGAPERLSGQGQRSRVAGPRGQIRD